MIGRCRPTAVQAAPRRELTDARADAAQEVARRAQEAAAAAAGEAAAWDG